MFVDEEHEYGERTYTHEGYTGWRRTSWGAIVAGAFVTLAVFLTLQMLGAGIGASVIDLTGRETTSAREMGIGAAVWWLIVGLISLFVGGWVAGRLARLPNKIDRILHGLTVWAVFYGVMFLLVTTALSALTGGGLALLGQGISAAGEAGGSPRAQQTMEDQGLTPGTIQEEIAGAAGADEQQARETGEEAANITGATFIGLAISMLLGAVAAILGSLVAPAPRYVSPRERREEPVAKAGAGTYTR